MTGAALPSCGARTAAMSRTSRLILATAAATLGGCDVMGPARTLPVQRRTPTEVRPITPLVSLSAKGTPGAQDPKKGDATQYVFLVRIKVVTIEVPVGTVSSSERIWNWLDEELVGADTLVNLGRNGLRMGVGRRDDWPAVAKMLKALTGRGLTQTLLMTTPSKPVSYVVKQRQGVQTIFLFYPDRTCSGADYPPGDNLLTMACTFDADEPQKLMMVGLPQIRATKRSPRIVKAKTGLSIVDQARLFSFDPLTFRLRFQGGDFLMIGPGARAGRPISVGHHFLIQKRKGVQFETVLILIPEVVAAPVRGRAPSALGGLRGPATGTTP